MLRYSSYNEDWVRESNSIESYGSDKSSAAENQQERLIKIGWITGYVDGEGCFSINLIRQPHRHNRRGYKTGFQVAHEFAVTQGASSVDSLHLLVKFFGVGAVYINRRYDNHKEHVYRYCVRAHKKPRTEIIRILRDYTPDTDLYR